MQIIIINRTDKAQQIRKSNGDIVVIKAYSPYTLETIFKPEINFWTNCTDDRFIITDNVEKLPKILAQLPKQVIDKQQEMINKTVTDSTVENKPLINKNIITNNDNNQAKSDTGTTKLLDDAYSKTKSKTENDIRNLKLSDLKILASKQGIKIPYNCKKADLAELIINSINNK